MARLTENQLKLRVEREKKKQETIRKKMAIQEKKELYGENWKQVEQQKLQKELEEEIGNEKAPRIYDSKDLYDFFSPVAFYEDEDNKALKMDFQKFSESEELYSSAIEELNKDLKDINKSNNIQMLDGESESDSDYPINADEEEKLITKKTLTKEEEKKLNKIKRSSPQAKAKGRVHQIISTYFNRFVPLYDKHICTCCGMPKDINDYYVVYNYTCSNRVDNRGNYHLWACKDCCNKLFAYCYSVLANKNVELAMQYVCSYLNLYWDVDLFYKAKEHFEEIGRKGTLLGSYIVTINNNATGMSFMDSKFLVDEQYNSANRQVTIDPNEAPFDWNKEDARNKATVIKMVGYDPFGYETDENKKILYRDLLNILDEGMQNDLVKFQAGIQIVLSFFKIRQMNEKEHQLNLENAPITELKALSDLKAKELKAISDFSRDNGFSERYATAKAKGENTLTGIMNKMNEAKYEKAILNKYDIETSATIQQAAEASFKAIFNQLSLGESEVWKITQEQFEELTKLRKENSKLQEDLRKAKYREAELNLIEKKREKDKQLGIEEESE